MTEQKIRIGHVSVGSGCPPLVIAELSGNHNGSLDLAIRLVEAAEQLADGLLRAEINPV